MISKAEYNVVSRDWKGKRYQKYPKLKKRLEAVERNIKFFRGEAVFELGSNAGMYGYVLYPYIGKYIGVELAKNYYKQSLLTFKKKEVKLINSSFKVLDLESFSYSLFMANYVLHHLDGEEVDKLDEVFNVCRKVAIQTRSGDPLRYGHDEVGTSPRAAWAGSRIREMLCSHGFGTELQLCGGGEYNGIYLILAEKE